MPLIELSTAQSNRASRGYFLNSTIIYVGRFLKLQPKYVVIDVFNQLAAIILFMAAILEIGLILEMLELKKNW